MTLHLVYAPRRRHQAVAGKLQAASARLDRLRSTLFPSDDAMAQELAAVVADLVDVERYLQDASMDWRGTP